MPLHVSSTCAHHQEVKFYYTASGIITPIGVMKLIVKQKFCASSWLFTEINKTEPFDRLCNLYSHTSSHETI